MNKFAKLYETEKYGQIVVILQSDDEGDPEIRFFCQPPELGVCSVAFSFEDWDTAEEVFDEVGQEQAEVAAKQMSDLLNPS